MQPTLFDIPFLGIPIRGYGLMLMIGFLGATWWAARRAARVKADPEFIVNLGFITLIASVIGARLFYVIHYWHRDFAHRSPWAVIDLTSGGMEFYGGLIGAMVAALATIFYRRRSLRLYFDIMTPSVMFGMCMARIGCFLNGCCWGAPCPAELPWAVQFPYASPAIYRQWEERQVTLPAELIFVAQAGNAGLIDRDTLRAAPEEPQADGPRRDSVLAFQAKKFSLAQQEIRELTHRHHSAWVHPSQLYASIGGILLALLLNTYFYRRRRHGMVFGVFMLTYPVMRMVEEVIRIDNPRDTAGMTVSQFVSVVLILIGIAWIVAIHRQPLRSPRAVPEVAWVEEPPRPAARGKRKRK